MICYELFSLKQWNMFEEPVLCTAFDAARELQELVHQIKIR